MEGLKQNKPLLYSVAISGGVVLGLAAGIFPDLSNMFEIVEFPDEVSIFYILFLLFKVKNELVVFYLMLRTPRFRHPLHIIYVLLKCFSTNVLECMHCRWEYCEETDVLEPKMAFRT